MPVILRSGTGRADLAATDDEVRSAQKLLQELESGSSSRGEKLEVPVALRGLVGQVIAAVARGESVTVGTLPKELSTSVAAEQLGVSRPTLMKLIAAGELPAHKAGTHTRVLTADVAAFHRTRLDKQQRALDEMRALEDELGL